MHIFTIILAFVFFILFLFKVVILSQPNKICPLCGGDSLIYKICFLIKNHILVPLNFSLFK